MLRLGIRLRSLVARHLDSANTSGYYASDRGIRPAIVLGLQLFAVVVGARVLLVGLEVDAIGTHAAHQSATLYVTSPADNGPGTLRQALFDAQPQDIIIFDPTVFPPSNPITITLLSELPVVTVDGLTIDASNAGVVLDGSGLLLGDGGFTITGADGVRIQGLQILYFPDDGISIRSGAKNTTIGGDRFMGDGPLGQGNLISGNGDVGVWIQDSGTMSNTIAGNLIGTDISGTSTLGNGADGIVILAGASNNVIGGATSGTRNIISGNRGDGIDIRHDGTSHNRVFGNLVGTDISGTSAIPNMIGIRIRQGASNNIIGGETTVERNILSGNEASAVQIEGSGTSDNYVLGNFIGTDISGRTALPNFGGVVVASGAADNVVGGDIPNSGNLISGNRASGVQIADQWTTRNQIMGNLIGTDISGKGPLSNGQSGVSIGNGATDNVIGSMRESGSCSQGCNVISGNMDFGIRVDGAGTSCNDILGNHIGTDVSGAVSVPNDYGVGVGFGADYNIVGGDYPDAGNLISGNRKDGIFFFDAAQSNVVSANFIGTDVSGTSTIGNAGNGITIRFGARENVIGGNLSEARNLISGNGGTGVWIEGSGTVSNSILGNYVGTDPSGTFPLGNAGQGIYIGNQASGNIIGGDNSNESNLVRFNGGGLTVSRNARQNTIIGNTIHDNDGLAAQVPIGVRFTGNNFSNNGSNFAQVFGGSMTLFDETWSRQGDLNIYMVVDDPITIPSGRTWTLDPGVQVQFDFGLGARVEGTLVAEGTSDSPVRLTSAQRFASPIPGDWQGLTFASGSRGSLCHTGVEFAANGLILDGGAVNVISSTIAASRDDGILLHAGNLTLQSDSLAGNGRYALNNQTSTAVDASGTWWGHATGPDGLGDKFTGNVHYADWRTDPGFNDNWKYAAVLNPAAHSFPISSYRDLDWFRIPVGTRNATLTATLTSLPRDYDLFLFSQLGTGSTKINDAARRMTIGQVALLSDLDATGQAAAIARRMTIGQLAEVGDGFETGSILQISAQDGTGPETVSTGVWDQSGWYHLLVAGHNGANHSNAYTLAITVTEGIPVLDFGFEPPTFEPPEVISPTVRSLILTNRTWLQDRYGGSATDALMAKLDRLAAHPAVAGQVVLLDSYEPIFQTYQLWTENITNPVHANLVAASIQAMLSVTRTAYSSLEYLIIVGDDQIVPFWRIPDEAALANESSYNPYLASGSPVGAALGERYFLSDDPYASFDPIPWRGRGLHFPEYGLGRLVEKPDEVIATIEAFLASPIISATNGLVTGYDFLTDGAEAMAHGLEAGGLPVMRLINDTWRADELSDSWLETRYDLSAINAHFEHWQAIPANRGGGVVVPADVSASKMLSGTLNYSVGCHSGLSVPDEQAITNGLDFVQAILGRGGTWIANTGFGYGDADAVGYSELLMTLLTRRLAQGERLGHALRGAKAEYFNLTGAQSFSPYDEKVLAQTTLYGLPMVQVDLPDAVLQQYRTQRPSGWLAGSETVYNGLTTQQVVFEPSYITHTVTNEAVAGTYFSVQEETEVNEGQPIQPRTSLTITLSEETPHGAFFEGGTYRTFNHFDPVVTRVITEDTDLEIWQREPDFDYPETWQPSWWSLVNQAQVPTPEGAEQSQRLVVIPAQYRSTTAISGTERLFEVMTHTVYYSTTADIVPPSIWRVEAYQQGEQNVVIVEVTDWSDVVRVGAAYTLGDGIWTTVDLTRNAGDPNIWIGTIPQAEAVEWFVQAVDGGGNVAINDNKGTYFGPGESRVWLPLVSRTS